MSSYRTIVGRILSIIGNILILGVGAAFIYAAVTGTAGTIDFNNLIGMIVGCIVGGACAVVAILGFITTFTEISLTILNYVPPIASLILAVLIVWNSTKETEILRQIIEVTLGALLLLCPIGSIYIIMAEGRQ